MLVNNVKSIGMFGLKMEELLAIEVALAFAMNRTVTCPVVDSSSDQTEFRNRAKYCASFS